MTQRQEIIERLRAVDLGGGSHESLSALAKAIYEPMGGWTIGACERLRQTLVRLLEEAEEATCMGESITDELRKWIRDGKGSLLAIADRIDAAHEKAIASVMNDALYHANDKDMTDLGWYKALDADKQPIKLGDEVYQVKGGWVYTVESITFYPDNTTVSFGCKHGNGCDSAHNVRHYLAPTVEDVLREFADVVRKERVELATISDETIAEYAAKLRLAGGDAE